MAEAVERHVFGTCRRVVVKVGSSSLTRPEGGLDEAKITSMAAVVAAVTRTGRQVVLVSSGAISGALGPLRLKTRPRDLATQQAAASVGQGALMRTYAQAFDDLGLVVGQVLLSADDVIRRTRYRNAQRTLYRLMELGVVPIVNENDTVATDETEVRRQRPAGRARRPSGPRGGAGPAQRRRRALQRQSPGADGSRIVSDVHDPADIADVRISGRGRHGSGGMQTKVAAARIAAGAGIPVLLTSRRERGGGSGRQTHRARCSTPPASDCPPSCCGWRMLRPRGSGCTRRWRGRGDRRLRKSLLPAGIIRVSDDFAAR